MIFELGAYLLRAGARSMDEAPIKGLLDILPAYLNFVIGFLRSPRAALAPYALTGRVSEIEILQFPPVFLNLHRQPKSRGEVSIHPRIAAGDSLTIRRTALA